VAWGLLATISAPQLHKPFEDTETLRVRERYAETQSDTVADLIERGEQLRNLYDVRRRLYASDDPLNTADRICRQLSRAWS